MAITIFPQRFTMKPPAGVQLNRGHALAFGLRELLLFNEGGGNPINIADPSLPATRIGTASWVNGGAGVTSFDATNHVTVSDSGLNYAAGDFSYRAVFTPVSWTGGFTDTFMKGNEFRLFFDTSGNLSLAAMGGTDGGSCSTGMTAGVTYDFVITRSGSTCTCYVNGVNKGTFTNGNTTIQNASFQYAGDGNRGSQGDVIVFSHAFWNRALSASEVQQLYVDPYCFLQPQSPRMRFVTAPSGITVGEMMAAQQWGGDVMFDRTTVEAN